MQDVRAWADLLARQGGSSATLEGDFYTVTVETPDGDSALLSVYSDRIDDGPGSGTSVLMLRATAGAPDNDAPWQDLLAEASATWFARLYLENESGSLIAEAALPLNGVMPEAVSQAAQEVATLAVAALQWLTGDDAD